jgi:hypothetical protein
LSGNKLVRFTASTGALRSPAKLAEELLRASSLEIAVTETEVCADTVRAVYKPDELIVPAFADHDLLEQDGGLDRKP